MLTTDERRDLARAYAEGAHILAEAMRRVPTMAERMTALERFVPYGANYDRGVADEYHTAQRLIRDCRADEAEYFVGLAERCAARHGGV